MEFNAIQLIRVVRDHPQLYDASRADFKIPTKKEFTWRKIANKLSVDGKCVRERFTRR